MTSIDDKIAAEAKSRCSHSTFREGAEFAIKLLAREIRVTQWFDKHKLDIQASLTRYRAKRKEALIEWPCSEEEKNDRPKIPAQSLDI